MSDKTEQVSLCHRCEHRARWYETKGKWQPRCECAGGPFHGEADENTKWMHPSSKYACYMYQPVKPVVLAPIEGEDRPLFPMFSHFSGRGRVVRLIEGKLGAKFYEDGTAFYWAPNRSTQGSDSNMAKKCKSKSKPKGKSSKKK